MKKRILSFIIFSFFFMNISGCSNCKKFIHYDGNTLMVKGISMPKADVSIGEINKKPETLRFASEMAQDFDMYQFSRCELLNSLEGTPEHTQAVLDAMDAMDSLFKFKTIIQYYKDNPSDEMPKLANWISTYKEKAASIQHNKPPEKGSNFAKRLKEIEPQVQQVLKDRENECLKCEELRQKLYTFRGLRKELRGHSIFQDFVVNENEENINTVQHLWADTWNGSTINAFVDKEGHFLRVSFENRGNYPCDITIRPKRDKALKVAPQMCYLSYEARIPENGNPAAIAIRVVDGSLKDWVFGRASSEYYQDKVESNKWTTHIIELNSEEKWHPFQGEGNLLFGPEKPKFDVIAGVVFEFGDYVLQGRPSGGKGEIDIRNIKLLTKDDWDALPRERKYLR